MVFDTLSLALLLTNNWGQLIYRTNWVHVPFGLTSLLHTNCNSMVQLLCVFAAACQRDQEDSWPHYTRRGTWQPGTQGGTWTELFDARADSSRTTSQQHARDSGSVSSLQQRADTSISRLLRQITGCLNRLNECLCVFDVTS